MTELWRFAKWQWNKFEGWQKMFIASMFLLGASIGATPPMDFWLRLVSLSIVLVYFFKWAVWDGVKSSWANYQKEKKELFDVIKGDK